MIAGLRAFRRPRLWLRAWFVLLGLAMLVSLVPLPRVDISVQHFDKMEHFFGYAALAAYAAMLFGTRRAMGLGFVVVLALGAIIEGLQALVPWRSADALDMLANALGVLFGMVVAVTPLRHALQRFERLVVPAKAGTR